MRAPKPDIGLCFKTAWDYLNKPTKVNYRRTIAALRKAKTVSSGKEIRMPMEEK